MKKEIAIENFKRKDLFEYYHKQTNPFSFVTTKIDVTNIVNYCKERKHFYATLGYLINSVVNEIDAFKYRYENGKIIYYDQINSNYTYLLKSENVGFFEVDYHENYNHFIENFIQKNDLLKETQENVESDENNVIWISCQPWFSFTGLIPPHDHDNAIPQFNWDKIVCTNGIHEVNMMIMIHHGFADGYQIGLFIEKLTLLIKNLK